MAANLRRPLFIVGIVLIIGFLGLDIAVFSSIVQSTDISLFTLINATPNIPAVDAVMVAITLYGRELFWGVLIVAFFIFGKKEERQTAFILSLLVLILTILGSSIKFLEFRARPFQVLGNVTLLVPPSYDSSFPSGHTLIVVGGATVMWLRMRKRWAAVISIDAALVAYSRIFVGVHYPLDVLAGGILGSAVACLVMAYESNLTRVYDIAEGRVKKKLTEGKIGFSN